MLFAFGFLSHLLATLIMNGGDTQDTHNSEDHQAAHCYNEDRHRDSLLEFSARS